MRKLAARLSIPMSVFIPSIKDSIAHVNRMPNRKGEAKYITEKKRNIEDNVRIGHNVIINNRSGKIILPNSLYFRVRKTSKFNNVD